jgi:exodeoxyribonuclease VII small subunit
MESTPEKKQDTTQLHSNFEKAFHRLELILEQLNSGTVSLEDSLKLYEEADKLIISCSKKLQDAERKIEVLIKNRQGELQISDAGKPQTTEFHP